MIAFALHLWGAKEIREDGGEVFFLTLAGTAYLLVCISLFKWMGIGLVADVVERRNSGALVALCGVTVATALMYAGSSVGEGPSYLENVFSVGLALAVFFLLWILL